MNTGTVKWFNDDKGVGFITPDSGNEGLYAHVSAVDKSGVKSFKRGQSVSFVVAQEAKGKEASNIKVAE